METTLKGPQKKLNIEFLFVLAVHFWINSQTNWRKLELKQVSTDWVYNSMICDNQMKDLTQVCVHGWMGGSTRQADGQTDGHSKHCSCMWYPMSQMSTDKKQNGGVRTCVGRERWVALLQRYREESSGGQWWLLWTDSSSFCTSENALNSTFYVKQILLHWHTVWLR